MNFNNYILICLFFCLTTNAFPQTINRLKGQVCDEKSKRGLSAVSVSISDGPANDPTDTGPDGKFEINGTFIVGNKYLFYCIRENYKYKEIKLLVNSKGNLDSIFMNRIEDSLITNKETISGLVYDQNNNPISGVVVNISDGASSAARTNNSGQFELVGQFIIDNEYSFDFVKQNYEKIDTSMLINKDRWLGIITMKLQASPPRRPWWLTAGWAVSVPLTGISALKWANIQSKINNTNTLNARNTLQTQKKPWVYGSILGGLGIIGSFLVETSPKHDKNNAYFYIDSSPEVVGLRLSYCF